MTLPWYSPYAARWPAYYAAWYNYPNPDYSYVQIDRSNVSSLSLPELDTFSKMTDPDAISRRLADERLKYKKFMEEKGLQIVPDYSTEGDQGRFIWVTLEKRAPNS